MAYLKPPLHIPDEKVLRWHPAFALDSVPEVEAAPLPTPPIKETYTTAKDVLNVAQDRLTERVQAALAGAGGGEGGRVVKREESGVTNPELRGVSTALLEKVKCMLLCTMTLFMLTGESLTHTMSHLYNVEKLFFFTRAVPCYL